MKLLISFLLIVAINAEFNCTDSAKMCSGQGYCAADGKSCICAKCFTTNQQNDTFPQCNYHQTDREAVLLWQGYFGPFGAGYFRTGHKDVGGGALIFFFVGAVFICIIACVLSCLDNKSCMPIVTGTWVCLWIVGVLCFWWVGFSKINQSSFKDSNGFPLC